METNIHGDAPEDKSGKQEDSKPKNDIGGVKKKRAVLRQLIFAVLSTITLDIAQLFDNKFNKLICCEFSFILGAIALYLVFRNYSATKRKAMVTGCGVFLAATAICCYAILIDTKNKNVVPYITLGVEDRPFDPKNPFGTTLLMSANEGEISNIWAIIYWIDTNESKQLVLTLAVPGVADDLRPNFPQGLRIVSDNTPEMLPPFGQKTFVEIKLGFSPVPEGYMTNQTFQFCVEKNPYGEYVWTQAGYGIDASNIFQKLDQYFPAHGLARIKDFTPCIDTAITSIEDNSKVDPAYPIKVSYSWTNSGGEPAIGIHYQWCLADTLGHIQFKWVSYYDGMYSNVIWPHQNTNAFVTLTDIPWFGGALGKINAGNLFLCGLVSFQDIQHHVYTMQFRSERTNNEFKVTMVKAGGYFDEIRKGIANSKTKDAMPK